MLTDADPAVDSLRLRSVALTGKLTSKSVNNMSRLGNRENVFTYVCHGTFIFHIVHTNLFF